MHRSRKVAQLLAGLSLSVCLMSPANAISVAVVGALDKFLDSTILAKSGKAAEEAWVSSVLGFSVTITYKDESINAVGWELVDGTSDHWAYALVTDPAHYVLNLGVGQSGADTHYLFENLAALSWAVIDLSEMLAGQPLDFNFGRVSHISGIGGGKTIDLREPGTIGLLILGFALLSLRMARQSKSP